MATCGAVVLHGFGGTAASVLPLTEALRERGFLAVAPTLPGHGSSVEDLEPVTWSDLTAAVTTAADQVDADHLVVVGQSLGGALACWLASEDERVAGVACVNPLIQPDPELVDYLAMLLDAGERWLPAGAPDLADPTAREVAYDTIPLAALRSVHQGVIELQAALVELRCPVLIATSPQDHVVEPASSEHLAATVAGPVERLTLPRSFHVAALDLDRVVLAASVVDFARRVTRVGA